jgi:hypothetical protein
MSVHAVLEELENLPSNAVDEPPASHAQAQAGSRATPRIQAAAGLVALRIAELDEVERRAVLVLGDERLVAQLDDALDPRVLCTAIARRERVIAQRERGQWVVLGALRTAPTPGVDRGDDFKIEARRVRVEADYEFAVVSGTASLVIRAVGAVESVAREITTRATELNKIFGRIIRLN